MSLSAPDEQAPVPNQDRTRRLRPSPPEAGPPVRSGPTALRSDRGARAVGLPLVPVRVSPGPVARRAPQLPGHRPLSPPLPLQRKLLDVHAPSSARSATAVSCSSRGTSRVQTSVPPRGIPSERCACSGSGSTWSSAGSPGLRLSSCGPSASRRPDASRRHARDTPASTSRSTARAAASLLSKTPVIVRIRPCGSSFARNPALGISSDGLARPPCRPAEARRGGGALGPRVRLPACRFRAS